MPDYGSRFSYWNLCGNAHTVDSIESNNLVYEDGSLMGCDSV